ncbi:MAG: HEPN domain-containing protein [Lachnospiraceae bacterium]|nr:HEPN domain-containing protein [Lachnospiraceae bacterium]
MNDTDTYSLLEKAIQNYNVAVNIYESFKSDEIYLNYSAYHLQQSVELAIKHVLEQNGVEYPKEHAIERLIAIASQNGIDCAAEGYIDDHAEMFSAWEAKTRYIKDYKVELRKVEIALNEVNEFLDRICGLEIEEEKEGHGDAGDDL